MLKNFLETVLKIDRPHSASMADWDRWYENLKTTRPVAYYLAVRLPRLAARLHIRTFGRIDSLKAYLENGLVTKTHSLTSTSLKFGRWHELDDRILHCTMDSLVFFVENEMAGLWQISNDKKIERSAPDGLAYLNWASALTEEEVYGQHAGGELTRQARDSQEISRIYIWWTVERLKRRDQSEESGLDQFCESMDVKYPRLPNSTGGFARRTWQRHYDNTQVLTTEDEAEYGLLITKTMEIETARDNEDEEMLISLIKIRSGLWT